MTRKQGLMDRNERIRPGALPARFQALLPA